MNSPTENNELSISQWIFVFTYVEKIFQFMHIDQSSLCRPSARLIHLSFSLKENIYRFHFIERTIFIGFIIWTYRLCRLVLVDSWFPQFKFMLYEYVFDFSFMMHKKNVCHRNLAPVLKLLKYLLIAYCLNVRKKNWFWLFWKSLLTKKNITDVLFF